MGNKFNSPVIHEEDIQKVVEVLSSGWLAHGKYSKLLEEEILKVTGAKYCILLSSCTAALHLSLLALGVKSGDEVIIPAQTHVATAHSVEYTGAKAVFVDVDPITGNIDPQQIIKKINKRTKGIIPVHLAGVSCDMKSIMQIAKEKNLFVLEDCAHGMGSMFNKKHVGNFGIAGCFSFYPTKHFTTGEGGALVTNNKKIYEKVSKLRAFGIDTPIKMRTLPGKYDVKHLGYNYRMTDFQAALGYGQLARLFESGLMKRQRIIDKYRKGFVGNNKIRLLSEYCDKETSYMFFPIYVRPSIRDTLLMKLKELQIGTSVHYMTPVPFMSYYRKKNNFKKSDFPNAQQIGKTQICLPLQVSLSDDQIEDIINSINKETS